MKSRSKKLVGSLFTRVLAAVVLGMLLPTLLNAVLMNDFVQRANVWHIGPMFINLLGFVLSFILLFFIVRGMVRPIQASTSSLGRMADGDFTQRLPEKYRKREDEVGMLVRAVDRMYTSSYQILSAVKTEADLLKDSTQGAHAEFSKMDVGLRDVSDTTGQLASGMQQMAASAEEIDASTQEFERAVGSMTNRAEEGAEKASEISTRAMEMQKNLSVAVEKTSKVYEEVKQELSLALEESHSVAMIRELANSILQIAQQTNLLALNASIEAARAGDAGRGFAVVADEIRKLADASKQSVEEIHSVTEKVVGSVDNLQRHSGRLLDLMTTEIAADYQMMQNNTDSYLQDALFIENMIEDFSATSEQLSASIQNLSKAISEIAEANGEAAAGTETIFNLASNVLESSDKVEQQARITGESSHRLDNIAAGFRFPEGLDAASLSDLPSVLPVAGAQTAVARESRRKTEATFNV